MSTKTEEIIETIAKELEVPKAHILERSLRTFLERQLREAEVEIFRIAGKYGVSSVEEMEQRYREGTLDEGGSWEDFQRLDHLEYQRDRITQWLRELLSTPKAFQDGINLLKSSSLPKGYRPMLFLPFLGENQLQQLEREGISGIDLCGNGVVVVPGTFAVFRSGGKNRFPSSAQIKNIYRKNSSMAGRVFFPRSSYATVQEICAEINRRNVLVNRWNKRSMSLSTVSKALKTLEEDLIIARKGTIRLVQPDKLLEKLDQNYDPPIIKERVRLKVAEESGTLLELLLKASQALDLPIVATGMSSVTQYAVMQRGGLLSVYCPRLETGTMPELRPTMQSELRQEPPLRQARTCMVLGL